MDTSFVLLIGAIAGAVGGWITSGMLKGISLGNSSDSLGATVSQAVAALVGGGFLTAICALLKDLVSPKSAS